MRIARNRMAVARLGGVDLAAIGSFYPLLTIERSIARDKQPGNGRTLPSLAK